jgi:hypothetical protein
MLYVIREVLLTPSFAGWMCRVYFDCISIYLVSSPALQVNIFVTNIPKDTAPMPPTITAANPSVITGEVPRATSLAMPISTVT